MKKQTARPILANVGLLLILYGWGLGSSAAVILTIDVYGWVAALTAFLALMVGGGAALYIALPSFVQAAAIAHWEAQTTTEPQPPTGE